jgi:hypothetical protein
MEALGGKALTEKLPGLLPFPVVMRVIMPGAVLVLSLLPVIWPLVTNRPLLGTWGASAVAGLLLVLAAGITLSLMHGHIYQLYEGYFLWPAAWFKKGVEYQQNKVSRRRAAAEEYKKEINRLKTIIDPESSTEEEDGAEAESSADTEDADEDEGAEEAESQETGVSQDIIQYNYLKLCYDKIWVWLKMFPLEKALPVARCPTLLGNILKSYEDYPDSRYGMDAGFYWPRLWLSLEDDKKKTVDTRWSMADGILYSSFGLALSAVVYFLLVAVNLGVIGLSFLRLTQRTLIGPFATGWDLILAITMLCVAYLAYRLSLPYHRQNGESFMALFDLYRDNLGAMRNLGVEEKRKWDVTWGYLQYFNIHCECGKPYSAILLTCFRCGRNTEEILERIRIDSEGAERTEI